MEDEDDGDDTSGMEQLYHTTNRALQEAHEAFMQCERSGLHVATVRELQKRIDQIVLNCERLDVLVQKVCATHLNGSLIVFVSCDRSP